jgi:hypothetical protein
MVRGAVTRGGTIYLTIYTGESIKWQGENGGVSSHARLPADAGTDATLDRGKEGIAYPAGLPGAVIRQHDSPAGKGFPTARVRWLLRRWGANG